MANYGFKVSKPGFDVGTASDSNLFYSSKFNILKAFKEGSTTCHWDGTTHVATTKQIAHGLNFTPTFLAYIQGISGKWIISGSGGNADDTDDVGLDAFSDATNLNLTAVVSTLSSQYNTTTDFSVYYFIFGDTARETSTTTNMPSPVNYGIKITKPGFTTNNDVVEQMLFHSQMGSLKISAQGSQNITSGGTVAIAHNLAFIPAYIVMVSPDNITFYPTMYAPNVGGPSAYGWVDSTNLHLRSLNFVGQTHYFRYIIFANKIG